MKYWLLIILFLFSSSLARGQAGQATEIKNAPSAPAICNSARGWQYFDTTSSVMKFCSATNTWTALGGGGGAGSPGVFVASTSCGGVANCVQLIDDDATDNCGTAFTNWIAAINAFTGPGQAQVFFYGSGAGKGFLLKTCRIVITVPHEVWSYATLDFGSTQTPVNCIQAGPSGLTGFGVGGTSIAWRWTGGVLIGCTAATLTGIESMAWVTHGYLQNVRMINFGPAGNAAGLCGLSSIKFDVMAEGHISGLDWISSQTGACASANMTDCGSSGSCTPAPTGDNTLHFADSTITATNGANCGSVGHWEGGSHSTLSNVSIWAFGIPLRLAQTASGVAAGGWVIHGGTLDSAGCTAGGVSAHIQFGHTGSGIVQGPTTIHGVEFLGGATHATNMIAIAADSTDTIRDVSIVGNTSFNTGSTLAVSPTTLTCTGEVTPGTMCYQADNVNMTPTIPCATGGLGVGWQVGNLAGLCGFTAQTANLGSTSLYTATVNQAAAGGFNFSCQVVLTTAAATSSTLPQCVLTYTELYSNTTQTINVTPVWASGTVGCSGTTTNTVGNSCIATVGPFTPKAGTVVSFSTINYASVSANTMAYTIIGSLEANKQ